MFKFTKNVKDPSLWLSLSVWSIVCTEYTSASTFMTCNNELMNIYSCMEISNHEYSVTEIQLSEGLDHC